MQRDSYWRQLRRLIQGEPLPAPLRAPFRQLARQRTTRTTRALALFLLVFNFLAWPTDLVLLVEPTLVQLFVVLRCGLTACFLAILILFSFPRLRASAAAVPILAVIACLGSALGGWVSGSYGGLDRPFFYVIYAFSGITMILTVGLLQRIAITLPFTLSFVLVYFGCFPQHLRHPFVYSSLFVVFTANLAYVVIGEALYRLTQANFLQATALEESRRKSEDLLRNILPSVIAERLKDEQRPIADGFAEVTVLFADIDSFTPLSARLTPQALVVMLNRIFSAFDHLADKHGLEKIKTIGDAYMVAGGIPVPREDHARAVAELALDMREALARLGEELGLELRVRIGIHSGPVVAGVIGVRKFIYDLWGDTVNTASRMESHGLAGEIQLTEQAAGYLAGYYQLEKRGEIVVKGKGLMPTWLLRGRLGLEAGQGGKVAV